MDNRIDPSLRAEFIDESLESMEQVSALFVELERNPDDNGTIQSIFRPVHSIKGNAAYFGLLKTKVLAHEMETVLDQLRKGALSPNPSIISVLLKGCDEITSIFHRVRNNQPEVESKENFNALIEQVKELAPHESTDETALWSELFMELHKVSDPRITSIAQQLAKRSPAGRKAQQSKSSAQTPECLKELQGIFESSAEPDFNQVRLLFSKCMHDNILSGHASVMQEAISNLEILNDTIGLADPVSKETLLSYLKKLSGPTSPMPSALVNSEPDTSSKESEPSNEGKSTKTMRIPEERIDEFLSHVGELVTVGEMYSNFATSLSTTQTKAASSELKRINEVFENLSISLQGSIMRLRKVPIHQLLNRLPRIVRDVAQTNGKAIDVEVTGGDLLADKSLVDALEAPLMHMVRNAADHGVEPPEKRTQASKPPTGNVTIACSETEDLLILTVSDDGAGLNYNALQKKAVELGMLKPDQELLEADLINLLFMPGVSTAEHITDVSGRGVGMDVARKKIEEMGGAILVKSQPGKGTVFTLKLPKTVTTRIMTGFLVVAKSNRYVFPLDAVLKSVPAGDTKWIRVAGRGLCTQYDNQLLRIIRLCDLFFQTDTSTHCDEKQGILVLIEARQSRFFVHVDAIDAVRRIVIKEIAGLQDSSGLFTGGAIMGDGTVAMVLDADAIGALAV
jgi:two-component system, chemotaxis family, sensor kinase CheA